MLDTAQLFETYGLSLDSGFLSHTAPLRKLPDVYYSPWENAIRDLPRLVDCKTIRSVVERLPTLTTSHLTTPSEWQRAYVLLGFLTQAYIWGDDAPAEVGRITSSH
jgi:indoleamine 2,3-dioxygenase